MDKTDHLCKKIRVLYVVESFSTGVYAIVKDISCNLDIDKYEIRILHSLRSDSPKKYQEDFDQQNIVLKHIPMGTTRQYLQAIRSIKREITDFKPNTIHLHSSKAGFLGRIAAKRSSCSNILYSPHGFSFLRTDVNSMKRWIYLQLERWIDWYVPGKIIAVSEGERIEALRITEQSIVINNFIDTSKIPIGNDHDGYDILTTGRIAPQKNPELFNAIAKALPDYSFLWVGDGPLRSSLSASNITVTGLIPRSQVFEHLSKAKVYLQTSLWEGMPVSILEAMAAAKPVVASNIIGNRDLIQHEETGILCDPANPDLFVHALSKLLSEPQAANLLGKKAHTHVVEKHDLKIAIEKYSQEYTTATC